MYRTWQDLSTRLGCKGPTASQRPIRHLHAASIGTHPQHIPPVKQACSSSSFSSRCGIQAGGWVRTA